MGQTFLRSKIHPFTAHKQLFEANIYVESAILYFSIPESQEDSAFFLSQAQETYWSPQYV